MFTYTKISLTSENILGLLNADKLFIQDNKPVGNADHEVLSYAPSYSGRPARSEDLALLTKFIGSEIYITPVEIPESTFAEGIVA